ncbi:tRNA lysidine(34) synthetase TilS [Maribacter sp. 2210JD10-5]|uniref:tRNA lysidine(34) synthetase TilS n=1 Tax=Maribacter sp. 2210JD10-5 TaxID=3386272 RepID=UPI0039BD35B6
MACSGGLDSTVLFHLSYALGLEFSLAHCNFNLRGKESDDDAVFVKQLAQEKGLTLYDTIFDTLGYVENSKTSLQMAARALRYNWFERIMRKNNIPFLVTAHHADDNLETYLINLSRSTGIDGLSGIPSKNGAIRRPLLPFSRETILEYATDKEIKWREDKSNEDIKYLRNKIRKEIVPRLKELHPTFLNNFQNTQHNLIQTKSILEGHLQSLKKQLFQKKERIIKIAIDDLKKLRPFEAYLYELFREYGFTELKNLMDIIEGMSGKSLKSRTHVLLKDRDVLLLSELIKEESSPVLIEEQQSLEYPVRLNFSTVKAIGTIADTIIYVDKNTLRYPLVIRKWENGDYFYPFGLNGKKKLSKFFKDEKIDVLSKQKQWLLCSGEKIVWVIGKRFDDRFKVDEKTKEILRIEFSP